MYKDKNIREFILILPTQIKTMGFYLTSTYMYLLYSTPRVLSLKDTGYDRIRITHN